MHLKRVKLKKVTTFDQKSGFFNFTLIGCIFWLSHVYLVGISVEIKIFWYQIRPISKFGVLLSTLKNFGRPALHDGALKKNYISAKSFLTHPSTCRLRKLNRKIWSTLMYSVYLSYSVDLFIYFLLYRAYLSECNKYLSSVQHCLNMSVYRQFLPFFCA